MQSLNSCLLLYFINFHMHNSATSLECPTTKRQAKCNEFKSAHLCFTLWVHFYPDKNGCCHLFTEKCCCLFVVKRRSLEKQLQMAVFQFKTDVHKLHLFSWICETKENSVVPVQLTERPSIRTALFSHSIYICIYTYVKKFNIKYTTDTLAERITFIVK